MRLRLSKIMDITAKLELIATELEPHDERLALAIDQICDQLEGRNAVDLSKLPEEAKKVYEDAQKAGIKILSPAEAKRASVVTALGADIALPLVQGALGAFLGLAVPYLVGKGTQLMLSPIVEGISALRKAKSPKEFLQIWRNSGKSLGALRNEFEGTPKFQEIVMEAKQ